ncbi:hypothetical protein COCMIDRAFT_103966 [Bipolaris oryzae ATCC 44560]|uniref:Uncharacterized protein n=1 Tax=Bipolaris oryzae ATCC 44560 TaxID=930090 RepID=W6YXJ0_COCMI|nr:uncharacterized protein COCMIDRAFT_103966 [Bipolaris oryzae ATCC 44560]EUC42258.1 hypothetical protein COCMIDRAFT_103966 [Bipolaris oryzae ATCC 44560]
MKQGERDRVKAKKAQTAVAFTAKREHKKQIRNTEKSIQLPKKVIKRIKSFKFKTAKKRRSAAVRSRPVPQWPTPRDSNNNNPPRQNLNYSYRFFTHRSCNMGLQNPPPEEFVRTASVWGYATSFL